MAFPFGPLLGAIGSGVGSFFGSKSSSDSKVKGVPTPGLGNQLAGLAGNIGSFIGAPSDKKEEEPSMAEQGHRYRSYLDAAFPGTNSWERLGANTPAGSTQAAHQQTKRELKLQGRELRTRKDVARMQARASVISAIGAISPNIAANLANQISSPYGIRGIQEDLSQRQAMIDKAKADKDLAEAKTKTEPYASPTKLLGTQFLKRLEEMEEHLENLQKKYKAKNTVDFVGPHKKRRNRARKY